MKPQAHIRTVDIGARDWRPAMIVFASLFGAATLLLTLRSGALFDNPLFERLRMSSAAPLHISAAHRVSLDLHVFDLSTDQLRRFSVAHPLPADVAWSQPFSIGVDARAGFEVFGDKAFRDLLADERAEGQPQPHNDRMLLMLMLLHLHTHRS